MAAQDAVVSSTAGSAQTDSTVYEAPKDPVVSTSIDAKSGDSSPVKERTARFDIFSDQYQLSDPKTLQKNILYTRPETIKFTPPQFTNFYFAAGLPKPWMDEMAFRLNLGERGTPPITLHSPFYRNVQLEAGAERNWGKGVIAGGAVRHEDIHHPDDPANTGKEKGVTGFRTSLLARYALSESVRMYAGVGLIGINDDSVQLANPSTAPLRRYAGSFTVGRENWFTLAPWSVGGWQPYGALVVTREVNAFFGGGREGDHLATPEEQKKYCSGQACNRTSSLRRTALSVGIRVGASRPDPDVTSLVAYNNKPLMFGLVNGALSHLSLLAINAVSNGDNVNNMQTQALFDDAANPDSSVKFKGSSILSAADAIVAGMSWGETNVSNAMLIRQNWRYGLINLAAQKATGVMVNGSLLAMNPSGRPPSSVAEQIGFGGFLGLCDEASSLVLTGMAAIPDVRKDDKLNNRLTQGVGSSMIAGGVGAFLYSAVLAGFPAQEGLLANSLINPPVTKTPNDFLTRGVLNQCFARGGAQAVWTGYRLLDAKSNFDRRRKESQEARLTASRQPSRLAQIFAGATAEVTPVTGGAILTAKLGGPDDTLTSMFVRNPFALRRPRVKITLSPEEEMTARRQDRLRDLWDKCWEKTDRFQKLLKEAMSKDYGNDVLAVEATSQREFLEIINEWRDANGNNITNMTTEEFNAIYNRKYSSPKK